MSLRQFLLVLHARRLLALGIFAVVVGVIVSLSLIWPKQYTATASVVIDAKTEPVEGMVFYSAEMLSGYIATQVDIIASERVVRRVVTLMRLDESVDLIKKWQRSSDAEGDFTSWLVVYLQKRLAVTPSRDSDVVNIAVQWPDAKFAAALANAFAQAYIETNIELKVEPAKQFAKWFDERSRALRADLEVKQKRLSDYQKQNGIVATDEKLDVETARLNELSTQLVAIQAQRQDSQSRQQQLSGDLESLPEVLQSPVIASLKDDLAQAEAKEPDIAARLGKNHPDYQAVQSEIASLRSRIAQESSKIAASLGSTTQVNVRREYEIRLALEAQKKLILELKHQHDAAGELQNDVLTAQRDLDAVTLHRAQSSLESQMQQSTVVLLTAATEPLRPSSPKLLINLLLGIFLGLVLGIGAAVIRELRDPLLRDDDEVAQLLGVPILGKIGRMKFVTRKKRASAFASNRLEPSVS